MPLFLFRCLCHTSLLLRQLLPLTCCHADITLFTRARYYADIAAADAACRRYAATPYMLILLILMLDYMTPSVTIATLFSLPFSLDAATRLGGALFFALWHAHAQLPRRHVTPLMLRFADVIDITA